MSEQGLEKLVAIYRKKWDAAKNLPKKIRCGKLHLCDYYTNQDTAPVRLALRDAMIRIATSSNPKLPICNKWTLNAQQDFLRRIVRGGYGCEVKGPYGPWWKVCMGYVKQFRKVAKDNKCSVYTLSEARTWIGEKSGVEAFYCNKMR